MAKTLLTIMLFFITAYYTGRHETFTTVTGKAAVRCEYQASGYGKFWATFFGYTCPQSIEVG